MSKITKKNWAGRGKFHTGVLSVLDESGVEFTVNTAFDPKTVGARCSVEAVAMTNLGRLRITVFDNWVAMQFALSDLARSEVGAGLSGKWNYHPSEEIFDDSMAIAEAVDHFRWMIGKVSASGWHPEVTELTSTDIDGKSASYWERREAMGEKIVITDFDIEKAGREMSEESRDANGNWDENMGGYVYRMVVNSPDVVAYHQMKAWRERNPVPGAGMSR